MSDTLNVERVHEIAERLLRACEGLPHDVAIMGLLDAAAGVVRMLRPSLTSAEACDHLATIIATIKRAEGGN